MIDALTALYEYFINGTYTFIQEVVAGVMIWGLTLWFKFKVVAVGFMWGVAGAMIDQLGLSALIEQYWGQLDSSLVGFCTRYKIPEALNLIINARVTKFIWSMV